MKLSMNLWKHLKDTYGDFSDDECIEILKNAGFDGVDFPFCDWENESETLYSGKFERWIADFGEKLRANGLCISQTHLPYLPGDYPPKGDSSYDTFAKTYVPMAARALELTNVLGGSIAVLHLYIGTDADSTLAGNKKYIDALRPFCERYGVKIAFENIFGYNRRDGIIPCFIGTEEEMLRYAEYGGSDCFGLCLDTGHAMLLGDDPVKLIKAFGSRLIALHVNSNTGSRRPDDLHLLPDTMHWSEPVKWAEISAALKEIGYCGSYNLELMLPAYSSQKQVLSAFVKYAGTVGRYYAELAG